MTSKVDKETLRQLVEELTLQVLKELEPENLEISSGMITPLFAKVLSGQIVSVNHHEHAGALGGVDLLVYTVVPLVHSGLVGEKATLDRADIRRMIGQTRSPRARRRIDALEKTVNTVLKQHTGANP